MNRGSLGRVVIAIVLLLCGLPASASHFRGGNVAVQVTETGVATFTYETLWRKGIAFFPFDGVAQIRFYNPTDTTRGSALRTVSPNIGNTTVYRDVSDPAFDFRRQVVTIDLVALGLAPGRYIARWENCCRIAGIQNAPEDSFSLETLVIYDGTRNGSPFLNSRILTVVGKGLPYSQNLNAFDPDGKPLTYQFLLGANRPTYGPSSHTPGITLDVSGQVTISAQSTATLRDINPFNPAGDYVFKVRVTDGDGSFAERDVLLDVVATANLPPEIAPLGNRVVNVGDSLVLPITAADPNQIDRVTLRTSALPANTVFVQTPGNPASGTLAFRPDASQVGTHGINVEALDNGTPVLTDSELVTITVLDPNNDCPVLAPIGNHIALPGQTLTFAISGADPDAGQPLTFSASFLPPGAAFDPATRTFSWTPTSADVGVRLGTVFEVRDSAAPPCVDREVVGFSVQPANGFPVLDPIGNRAAAEGSMISFTVTGGDPDGDAVAFAAGPLPVGALFDPAARLFMWRPTRGQAGVYEITFRISDSGSPQLSDQETARIAVARSGEEEILLLGLAEGQTVAGTVIVEAQVRSAFPTVAVDFAIDGVPVNRDEAAPFFIGPEVNGLPAGFDTTRLADGLHVLSATALDTAGQTLTTQRKLTSRNQVPPELIALSGLFDGSVVSGTIFVGAEARDDQQVASVAFAIDGTPVTAETVVPYFLNGTRFARGTFNVSCRVCLQEGDADGDLVVTALDEDGTLAMLCRRAPPNPFRAISGGGTGDGKPPSVEDVCDDLGGQAYGLCTAFCEAQDCDAPGKKNNTSCNQLRENFSRLTDEPRFPCEQVGACIHSLTLGLVSDPTQVATFDPEDFSGEVTTFELPFPVPVGYDTGQLADGEHTLVVTLTDNQGLTSTFELHFFVRNAAPAPGDLQVSLTEPANGASFEAGRLVPVTATVASPQGPVTVSFYADGQLVNSEVSAPFQTVALVPEGTAGSVSLVAVARDDRGPRQSPAVGISVVPRPVAPAPIAVLDVSPEVSLDGRVAVDSSIRISFTREVASASLADAVRLLRDGTDVPLALALEPDGRAVVATPLTPLVHDALYVIVIDGAQAPDGAQTPRFTDRFLTLPNAARVVGMVVDTQENPLAGIGVRVGEKTAVTDENGVFRIDDAPHGLQLLHTEAAVIQGLTYPPMEYEIEVEPGPSENEIASPIFLPALDLAGGLDVVGGVAAGSGILGSSKVAGVALDLRGVRVSNLDGTPFTGRMSISPVPVLRVPMPSPIGVYSSSYITVQPVVRFDPPAPITYPNLDGALPGEQIPLWHFDHGVGEWLQYAIGTVTFDGQSIVSNPGQGLPESGWGSPAPPNTFTTVVGTVVDAEGSPLHGVMVGAGNVRGITKQDGTYRLENVPAGRQGSPINIDVLAIARDIEVRWYPGLSSPFVRAVQNGTTFVGEVVIKNYKPLIDNRIVLHGDFEPTVGADHFLKVNNTRHEGEIRYLREVEELQRRLRELGFRQGGSTRDHGQELQVTGIYNEETKKAVKLFQTLELNNGGGGSLGGDGVVGRTSLRELNLILVPELWKEVTGFVDWNPGAEPADAYGTPDIEMFIGNLGGLCVNDISNPSGGNHPDHSSHETGIDVDVMLPAVRPGAGPRHTPNFGGTTGAGYDRAAVEQMLRDAIDSGATVYRFFADTAVCNLTHNTVRLCIYDADHYDHVHFRIDPTAVAQGVNAFAALTESPSVVVSSPGTSDSDVALDGLVVAELSDAFDPDSLNAATVSVEGPAGAVPGDIVPDSSGRLIRFTPAEPLAPATTYRFTVSTGAVLADGTLLSAPVASNFTTESARSLRVIDATPAFTAAQVPQATVVTVRFSAPVDPTTLLGAVRLEEALNGTAVPVRLSLTENQTLLTLVPERPLAFLRPHALSLAGSIGGEDGSPLVVGSLVTSFSTALPAGLVRVDIQPHEVVFTRADLAPAQFVVTGVFADGSTLDLTDSQAGGTRYSAEPFSVADVSLAGVVAPAGNGTAIIDVQPNLLGFDLAARVDVDSVFPQITFVGRQFALEPEEDIVLGFSEPVDRAPLAIENVSVQDRLGNVVVGSTSLAADGLTLTFDPAGSLAAGTELTIRFDLMITDGMGITRAYPRVIRFATALVNLGFELGDLTGFEAEGDVSVVQSFGPLLAPQGSFMAKLITSDAAVGGRTSTLRAIDLVVPEGATTLKFTYNFLTDEVEQGNPFNDFFRAKLVRPDGTQLTFLTVTRDQIRSGPLSSVPGFDRMTGYKTGTVAVQPGGGHLILEVLVSDTGDASVDSAVLVDDIRFE